jgi:dCTP deaminase
VILSDRDLRVELLAGRLVIDPPPADAAIQPASIDLHLGKGLRLPSDSVEYSAVEWDLWPAQFILGHTVEHVAIPAHLVGQLNGKSSLGRLGLSVHITAGFIDPGFRGQITLELHNCSSRTITLTPGMSIGQLVLMRLTSPAERPYGSAGLGSHYQGQTGATPSAVTR